MAEDHIDIADALAEAATAIHGATVEETLDAIVHATRASVPGFSHVGVSVIQRDGTIETRASTGPLVRELDQAQYVLGEGPCITALHASEVVTAEHLAREVRWPRYVPEAVRRGVLSQMGVRLSRDDRTLGSLNFYSTTSETVDADAARGAELFARHAALALGAARREAQLSDALETRTVIGQAVGIIMERYGIPGDRAFQFLVRASSTSNKKLRDVASELVERSEPENGTPASESEHQDRRL
jgi:GAF domain-containing protein